MAEMAPPPRTKKTVNEELAHQLEKYSSLITRRTAHRFQPPLVPSRSLDKVK